MPARILDGRALAAELRPLLAARAEALHARSVVPRLVIVAVGEDAAGQSYTRALERLGARLGVEVVRATLAADAGEGDVRVRLRALGSDDATHGVMLQQPLPRSLSARAVADAIPPRKDVDGANPINQGLLAVGTGTAFVPATPAGVMLILGRSDKWPLRGLDATVVGRSPVVGLPVALLLVAHDATVTVTHSKTRDLRAHLARADVVVVAAGRPGLVRGDMLKPGATVVDVGTNVVDGATVGDVDFASAQHVAAEITPVPGGVGPLTAVALMRNVLTAAERLTAP